MPFNLFDVPVYYISFKRNNRTETALQTQGFKNINHFEAIDGRKFDPKMLRDNHLITARSYTDLIDGREQHSGLTTLGAVGCTFSHLSLWKKCVDDNMNYIIIAEEDVMFDRPFTQKDIRGIVSFMETHENSIFVSAAVYRTGNIYNFIGLHFYIVSRDACIEMVKDALPIDVQTDAYISHLADLNRVSLDGNHSLAHQIHHPSSIQTYCFKCDVPKEKRVYMRFIMLITFGVVVLCILVMVYFLRYRSCNQNLVACRVKS